MHFVDYATGFQFDDSWQIPREAIEQLEEVIEASDDLPTVKAAVAKINELKYGNGVMSLAISTAR